MKASVIIEYPVKSLDKLFTYIVPSDLESKLKVGMKVLVPFGPKSVNGVVLNIVDDVVGIETTYELKEIIKIVDENFVLQDELLKLGKYMSEETLATRISCYQAMFPSGFKVKNKKHNYDKYDLFLKLCVSKETVFEYIEKNKRSYKKIEIINLLMENEKINKKDVSLKIVNDLVTDEIVSLEEVRVYRLNADNKDEVVHSLTVDQEKVYKSVQFNEANTYLLYGVTGSGKTEVYLKLIEDVIKSGKTAIMLVPEISLTMQIVKRFYSRFKDDVAVFHSALSDGEKYDEYLKILNKDVKIVVGTRSAIFAPLQNIGIIIIDEEHSDSYKQDNNPRYHARDMALFRSSYNNCPLVLGSATPLLETMARALKGNYKLLTLKNRVNGKSLPETIIVDMNKEVKKKNFIFSDELKNKMIDRINKGEQIILLLNRRGYSTFINCSNCGFVYKCPNCDISLTYHKTSNNLMCHYCGHTIKKDKVCPKCSEDGLNYLGLGTEQIEEYIKENIFGAKIIRMDQDTTSKKGSHDKIIESFRNKEFNILLGTSMISKGLDFSDVTLVGVINADISLNIPDYKSGENTYSLLSQVSGRSGRSEKIGEVVLQTYNPDNFIINCVKNNDYKSFFLSEMKFRKELKYSPYYYLVSLKIVSKDFELALSEAKKVVSHLKINLSSDSIVLGPTTAALLKYKNNYRFQVIIKYKKDDKLKKVLKNLDNNFSMNYKVNIEIDFNPNKV